MMREFFGFGGYTRTPEGYFSWQHLTFVTCLMILMATFALLLGKKNAGRSEKEKNRVLVVAAIAIDIIEIARIVLVSCRLHEPMHWIYELPLFMCSLHFIVMPLAAFSKGRLREASLDFVVIFGILAALFGTYFAGQNYGTYPVLSVDNVVSGITHSMSGFASIYILRSGMGSMKTKNIPITFGIITGGCVLAYLANAIVDYNYMFLRRGDGTPYDIFLNLVHGNQIVYPIIVLLLFFAYIALFYGVYFFIRQQREKAGAKKQAVES